MSCNLALWLRIYRNMYTYNSLYFSKTCKCVSASYNSRSAAQRMNFEFRGNLIEKQYLDVGDCMHICETSQNDHSTFVPQVLTNLILTLFNFSLRSFGRILFVRRI